LSGTEEPRSSERSLTCHRLALALSSAGAGCKPRGAPGSIRRQRRTGQRTRRRRKASRSRASRASAAFEKDEGARARGDAGAAYAPRGACAAVGGGKAPKGRTASRGSPVRAGRKRGEPQDRQRDETGLHGPRRSKPSRWWKTTRTERGRARGSARPEYRETGIRVDSAGSRRWRGVLWTTPGEEVRHREVSDGKDRDDGKAGVKVRRVTRRLSNATTRTRTEVLEGPGRA
jgi:hypothetical protein